MLKDFEVINYLKLFKFPYIFKSNCWVCSQYTQYLFCFVSVYHNTKVKKPYSSGFYIPLYFDSKKIFSIKQACNPSIIILPYLDSACKYFQMTTYCIGPVVLEALYFLLP